MKQVPVYANGMIPIGLVELGMCEKGLEVKILEESRLGKSPAEPLRNWNNGFKSDPVENIGIGAWYPTPVIPVCIAKEAYT